MKLYHVGIIIVGVLWSVLAPMTVLAQSAGETFTIDARYGENTDPPTVPDPVTATPISPNQIDIQWGASSDPFGVGGYQLFRDGVQIDTVTQTTYSDTGLQASTTYSYFVRAFDIDGLVSSSSVVVATTTFAEPPDPRRVPVYQVGRAPEPALVAYEIVTGANSARLTFRTSVPTWYTLQYGRSDSFGDGVIQTEVLRSEHTTLLTNLEPSTTYEYELHVTDRYNQQVLVRRASFTTEPRFITQTSNNVRGLRADVIGDDVLLRWRNPDINMFSHVRVVRNHRFFPTDPWDGEVVYEGVGQVFIDSKAVKEQTWQYYTVFAFDLSGNHSSGALVVANKAVFTTDTPWVGIQPDVPVITLPTSTPTTTEPRDLPEGLSLRFSDIDFIQNDIQHSSIADRVELSADFPFLIRLPVSVVPSHLKIITVTIARPEGRPAYDTYLLRRDEEGAYYEAMVDRLETAGEHQILLSIYDLQEEVQYQLQGFIDAITPVLPPIVEEEPWYLLFGYWLVGLLGVTLVSLWLWRIFLLLWRQRKSEDGVTASRSNL